MLDTLFNKTVPSGVRDFISMKSEGYAPTSKKQWMILNLNTTITVCEPTCRPVWRFWRRGRESNRSRASLQNSGAFGQDKNRCNSRVPLRCYRVDIQAGEREVGYLRSHLSVYIGRQRRPLGRFRRFNMHVFRVGC